MESKNPNFSSYFASNKDSWEAHIAAIVEKKFFPRPLFKKLYTFRRVYYVYIFHSGKQ